MRHPAAILPTAFVFILLLSFMVPALSAAPAPSSGVRAGAGLQLLKPGRPVGPPPAGDIRDIKGPLPIQTGNPLLIWSLGGLAALLVLGLLFMWWWKKYHRRQRAMQAHEVALAMLEEAKGLKDPAQARVFAARVADILRGYIEDRFFLSARRQTTREFISSLTDGTRAVPPELAAHGRDLHTWLEHCDMAKFACYAPSPETMEEMEKAVRNFIELTRLPDDENKKKKKNKKNKKQNPFAAGSPLPL
ncbi:MAG TPA: hypothetical protein ENG79_10155 [Desulfobacteraceae bacterium]|nr:hypothetical protein BMS3Abin13_00703 [bacterium BMS3Abin13]HDO31397.1 hypothetical protein [Desulfobacteraceae bacterium]